MNDVLTGESYALKGWSLEELLPEPTEELIAARLEEIEKLVSRIESARAALESDPTRELLLETLQAFDALTEKNYLLSGFGQLQFAADTQSADALAYKNRMERTLVDFDNRVLFFPLWWKGLDDEAAAALMPDRPDYRHFLEDLRRTRPYMLEERSEQIVNLKDTHGISAVLTVYSMLTNRLEFELEVDGETHTLSRDELLAYVYSPEPEVRAAAYRELMDVFGREARIFGQIYVSRALDWHAENVALRGFASPIAVRNVSNDVPDQAVEVLLETCCRNAPVFQRYFRWKARQLGHDTLPRHDLYAPLAASDKTVPYAEAVELVLATFDSFEPRLAELAARVFDHDHIDAEPRRGKKAGAFCATVLPSQTPWLLLNYTGKLRDVATLAHELGHAVHSMMAEGHSVLTQHPSLPLAETASVFAERLLIDRLLAGDQNPAVRRELLASSLDDVYATVMRQAYFVRFEEQAHAAILAGKGPEDLSRLYTELLSEQFGGAVDVAPEFAQEWVSIPHIYQTPFYCYAYCFGQLLVLALYRRYKEEGRDFIPGYLRLLQWGGSARPEEILAEAGVDITDPGFWQGGFDVVESLVDELERL